MVLVMQALTMENFKHLNITSPIDVEYRSIYTERILKFLLVPNLSRWFVSVRKIWLNFLDPIGTWEIMERCANRTVGF